MVVQALWTGAFARGDPSREKARSKFQGTLPRESRDRRFATLLSHAGRRAKLADSPSITPIVVEWVMQIQISAGVALMATAGDAARLNVVLFGLRWRRERYEVELSRGSQSVSQSVRLPAGEGFGQLEKERQRRTEKEGGRAMGEGE